MKKKFLLSMLLVSGFLALSSCSLFNDDDIKIHNSYNPPADSVDPDAVIAGGVVGKRIEETPNAYCFRNIPYGVNNKVTNTYKTGGANVNEFNVNNGQDYDATKIRNNYDLYVPDSANKADKHIVMLFIHGGAWVSGVKSDVNPYVYEFANKGYITATIKYTLLKRSMDDNTLSIFRDLDEIDACVTSLKNALQNDLGFDTTKTKFVIGGASSGAHLAMLYAYSRGNKGALKPDLVVNAVGPVDIKPDNWKEFNDDSDVVLNAGITASAINTQRTNGNLDELTIAGDSATWNDYQTMRIANGMCGLPYSLSEVEASTSNGSTISNPNAASTAMTKNGGGEDQLSVTYWMNSTNKIPMVCAYAGKDSIVGIAQFAKLEEALIANSTSYDFVYFKNSDHMEISKEKDETAYTSFLNKIEAKCQNL